MFKSVSFYANFNEKTGYGIHATNFVRELEKLIPVIKNKPGGEVSISLLDVVTAQHIMVPHPYPSILYSVWESTRYPDKFMENCEKLYHQLWVPSKWQRDCSIAQGLPEGFVSVVPEGVDPGLYNPNSGFRNHDQVLPFDYLIVGKWEDRKYTLEMIQAWLQVFKYTTNVRLFVSADNPFPVDNYSTTEERLKAYGLYDERVIPIHFEDQATHIKRMQAAHVYLSCSRAEGWNLPLIEAMACGIPAIALDWSGSSEFYSDHSLLVKVEKMIKPFNVYGQPDCPGLWAEPDYEDLKRSIEAAYIHYKMFKEIALKLSHNIREDFSWKQAAHKAYTQLEELYSIPELLIPQVQKVSQSGTICEKNKLDFRDIFVVGCWPSSSKRMDTLVETIQQIKSMGYPICISTHYPLPAPIVEMVDYVIFEKSNILSGDWKPTYSRQGADGKMETKEANKQYHGVACLNAIRNAIDFCKDKYHRMFYMEFDLEVDLKEWVAKVDQSLSASANSGNVCMVNYEGTGVRSDFFAGYLDFLNEMFPHVDSWDSYMGYGYNYVLENWLLSHFKESNTDRYIDYIPIDIRNRFDQVDRDCWENDIFSSHFVQGPFLQISGISNRLYDVTFSNPVDGNEYKVQQKCGTWTRPSTKFYRDWDIKATINGEQKFHHKFDLKDKRVLISMGSKALGDTIAWMPYLETFRLRHECKVIASTFWNSLFDYPEIEFVPPGSKVEDLYASYEIGCYDGQRHMNPVDWRLITLQKVATDILGLEYHELRPKIALPQDRIPREGNYICFSEFSTMQAKLWNKQNAWQTIIDYCRKLGYECVALGTQESNLSNITKAHGQSIQGTIADLMDCKFYIGLGHGPAWLAWALNTPVVMISGFSEPWAEFANPYRIIRKNVCHGCFNNTDFKFDRGWEWCPAKKNYECTRKITPEMVINTIDNLRGDLNLS